MSFFSTILEKLGLKQPASQPTAAPVASASAPAPKPATPAAAAPKPAAPAPATTDNLDSLKTAAAAEPVAPAAPKVAAISEVDVVKKLEDMAAGSSYNWKVSIVDLLKVLGLDSDKDARIALAKELGCPAELIGGDYSKMNVWLHKEVLKQIAQNGGNIPKELLD